MTQARDAFALKLHGRQYREEITEVENAEAVAARLLVVFGAGDDATIFAGLVDDEAGAWQGYEHIIIARGGFFHVYENDTYREEQPNGVLIEAVWCPDDGSDASWLIKPSVPFAPFDIMEDGELYCRGAVIDEADLLPAQRLISTSPSEQPCVLLVQFSEPLTKDDLASIHEYLKGWSR